MATTAADPVFVDTNILVFANTATAPFHAEAQAALLSLATPGVELWISRQVLREYLATLSRPQSFTAPVPVADADRGHHPLPVRSSGSPRMARRSPRICWRCWRRSPSAASRSTTPTSWPRCRPTACAGS